MKAVAGLITALLLALTIAACGDGDLGPGPVPRGDGAPLVSYSIENGLARTHRTLDVRDNGRVRLSYDGRVSEYDLSDEDFEELGFAVRDADFGSLEARYEQTQQVSDSSVITVTSQGKQVTVLLPADPPDELQHVIDLMASQIHTRGKVPRDVPGPSDNLLAYERSGGVAGISEKLFIRSDGAARIEIEDRVYRLQLTENELNGMRWVIDRADFKNLQGEYSTNAQVADGFVHEITAEGRTIRIEDSKLAPGSLKTVILSASVYIERYR